MRTITTAERKRLSTRGLEARRIDAWVWEIYCNGQRVLRGFVAQDENDALMYGALLRAEHPEWFPVIS